VNSLASDGGSMPALSISAASISAASRTMEARMLACRMIAAFPSLAASCISIALWATCRVIISVW
jgi:hypothetical protein